MSSWNPQQQVQNTNVMGQAQFSPYVGYNWNVQQRAPIYHADPIHGENAAWQFPMGPNSEIYLPDADQDIIWWIRTDSNGNKEVIPFDAYPHKKEPTVDTNDLAARVAALEERLNAQQNKSNAKQRADTTTQSVG